MVIRNQQLENKIRSLVTKYPHLKGFYLYMNDRAPGTVYNYILHVSNFLEYVKKTPNELSLDDFTEYIMKIRRTQDGELSTPSYKITCYQALKKYGKYLTAKGVLQSNPMDYVDRPIAKDMQKTVEKRANGYFDEDEIAIYLSTVKDGAGSDVARRRQEKWRNRDISIIMIFAPHNY